MENVKCSQKKTEKKKHFVKLYNEYKIISISKYRYEPMTAFLMKAFCEDFVCQWKNLQREMSDQDHSELI